MKISAIITCAGKGERAGFNKNKLLEKYGYKTVLEQTYSVFFNSGLVDEIIVTVNENDEKEVKSLLGSYPVIVKGGETRTQSVKNALERVTGDIVLIHDGARPNLSVNLIKNCIDSVKEFGSGIAGVQSRDTVATVKDGEIVDYLNRNEIFLIQTPQAFYTKDIIKAYTLSGDSQFNDDSEVYKTFIRSPRIVKGEPQNVKLTYPEDFNRYNDVRFGVGFDCHELVAGRKLILGGIKIPHDKGLLGHSDADVLTHAVIDAILSALSLRDIGYHFPPTDEKYKDADSMMLLKHVLNLIYDKKYKVKSVSAVVMAEKPKLLKYVPEISKNLAIALNVSTENVGITVTTLEGLGFVGREEGICVHANALLIKN